MRILFTGGGTMGSVAPLLAVAKELIDQGKSTPTKMSWIGTSSGPEREVIGRYRIPFLSIQSGKFRRYFSWKNFSDPFLLMVGIVQAIKIIRRVKPDVILGAGGYVQVPVMWAAWLMKKKIAILQLDITPSLANMLCISMSHVIFLSFDEQVKYFPKKKSHVTGLPIRQEITESKNCSDNKKRLLGLDPALPTVLITGGGTGSEVLNNMLITALHQLIKYYNIIHLTGKGKHVEVSDSILNSARYQQFAFLSDTLVDYLSAADIVITRGGMALPSECAFAKKPMIIIPIPDSHQEKNAAFFEKHGVALWRSQHTYSAKKMISDIQSLLKPATYSTMQNAQKQYIHHNGAINIVRELQSII
ncbi:MAG: UDP-N-acetylglucosamine--N-acetylmuramyl-(pentapeptide) pyrophosphoryl-undecaprenol N-acetylglucosamine transferase [bacterium]|nr:UDP-N-acetylglucosamine--N-acetylmuramyl-(pentapeptide) pyrophosphoryl-undecaprenol N-acetylglucosamine transferase [bacterium]